MGEWKSQRQQLQVRHGKQRRGMDERVLLRRTRDRLLEESEDEEILFEPAHKSLGKTCETIVHQVAETAGGSLKRDNLVSKAPSPRVAEASEETISGQEGVLENNMSLTHNAANTVEAPASHGSIGHDAKAEPTLPSSTISGDLQNKMPLTVTNSTQARDSIGHDESSSAPLRTSGKSLIHSSKILLEESEDEEILFEPAHKSLGKTCEAIVHQVAETAALGGSLKRDNLVSKAPSPRVAEASEETISGQEGVLENNMSLTHNAANTVEAPAPRGSIRHDVETEPVPSNTILEKGDLQNQMPLTHNAVNTAEAPASHGSIGHDAEAEPTLPSSTISGDLQNKMPLTVTNSTQARDSIGHDESSSAPLRTSGKSLIHSSKILLEESEDEEILFEPAHKSLGKTCEAIVHQVAETAALGGSLKRDNLVSKAPSPRVAEASEETISGQEGVLENNMSLTHNAANTVEAPAPRGSIRHDVETEPVPSNTILEKGDLQNQMPLTHNAVNTAEAPASHGSIGHDAEAEPTLPSSTISEGDLRNKMPLTVTNSTQAAAPCAEAEPTLSSNTVSEGDLRNKMPVTRSTKAAAPHGSIGHDAEAKAKLQKRGEALKPLKPIARTINRLKGGQQGQESLPLKPSLHATKASRVILSKKSKENKI